MDLNRGRPIPELPDDRGKLRKALGVRPGRDADEELRTQLEDVSAFERGGKLDPPERAVGGESRRDRRKLSLPHRARGTRENRGLVEDHRGVLHECGVRERVVRGNDLHYGARPPEGFDIRGVLQPGVRHVDGFSLDEGECAVGERRRDGARDRPAGFHGAPARASSIESR